MIAYCLGRRDVLFESDYLDKYFYTFDNIIVNYFGRLTIYVEAIISSNLIEVYLTGRVLFEMKKITNSAASILSSKAFQARKR